MSKMQIIPKGTLFIMSSGAYSAYSVRALCRATSDIDADALREEFLSGNPYQRERYNFEPAAFIAFVAAKGLFEEMHYGELHLGDYGDPDEMEVTISEASATETERSE